MEKQENDRKPAPLAHPTDSNLGDHDVPRLGNHLKGKRIALLATGSIACYRLPDIARDLRKFGASVKVYLSPSAQKYVTKDTMEWASNEKVVDELTPASEHLSGERSGKTFDLYLVLPATYNTINKFAFGRADSLVSTTLASALGYFEKKQTEIALCPVMHGSMHNSILDESIERLVGKGIHLIPPRDGYGKHNIPDVSTITHACIRILSTSKLKDKRFLLTGGSTPTMIDSVRFISNKFTGALSKEIALELARKGAKVDFVLPESVETHAIDGINAFKIKDYNSYKELVIKLCQKNLNNYYGAIFSAAVADYQPVESASFKIPSGLLEQNIQLKPTEKVIDLVQGLCPHLNIISFKYEDNISKEKLIEIAKSRVSVKGHRFVVANHGEEVVSPGEHSCVLVGRSSIHTDLFSHKLGPTKAAVAQQLIENIEEHF